MGTENPNRANNYPRPTSAPFAPPQSGSPFSSSRPVAGSAFRPASVPPPVNTPPPFPPGPDVPGFRPMQTVRPAPSFGPPTSAPFQRFPTPSPPPPVAPSVGQPILPPSVRPQMPPMNIATNNNLPQAQSSVGPSHPAAIRGPPAPTWPGYQAAPVSHQGGYAPPQPATSGQFSSHQGGYRPPQPTTSSPFSSHQGGYAAAPPVAAPLGMYPGGPTPPTGMYPGGPTPPTGPIAGLVEDFSSLSIGSVPGSFDAGLDTKVLPRPLEGDVEPSSFAQMYPMNCNSRYLRLTTSAIPNSQSLVSRWHLPLGAVVCPLAEAPEGEEVPIVNFATTGIVRCRRCRTYVNPYVTFTDGGRKWKCNICALLNDVQGDYYAQLDATGKRVDLDQRPELTKGCVEFVAPAEYMVRPPMPPLYFFLIDVSIYSVKSGMLEVIAETIKSCLDKLPGSTRTQIGFITFDSTIHFYNMKSSLTQPQMMVVSDLDDIFVPLPDDLLVNLSESRTVVDAFLDSLPSMFQDNVNVESAFGPALKAAYMVMSQLGGKLLIFQSTLPTLGVGRLRLRGDDIRAYGTDKENALRIPEDPFYKQMAADFTKFQVAVNVYAFSDKYTDIASLEMGSGSQSDLDSDDDSDTERKSRVTDDDREREIQDSEDELKLNFKEQPDEFRLPTQEKRIVDHLISLVSNKE